MNSNYGRSNNTSSSFDFDLGLNSNNKSLNDPKNKTSTTPYSTFSKPYSTPSWQPNKPSWTHQPAPPSRSVLPGSLSGPTSMVGDITGRSWANSAPAKTSNNNIGIVNKNPNLFGDLVGPALGQNKSNSNVPLKNLTPVANNNNNKSGFSMGGMADSLPKNGSASNNRASVNLGGGSYSKMDDFGSTATQKQPPVQPSGVNDFDVFFSSSPASVGGGAKGFDDLGGQQSSEIDDWDTEFGGGNDMGGTTELEGLPPPPSGVTAAAAKNKGMDNYKQGQFPDAIKWLSWAVILFGKAGDNNGINEALYSRASCYKEVGEYKKAVADCTKVLEHNETNVSVLVQRALLYESMEKYKLGAEDLRTVMRLDPSNRVARSTIHRLNKMAEG